MYQLLLNAIREIRYHGIKSFFSRAIFFFKYKLLSPSFVLSKEVVRWEQLRREGLSFRNEPGKFSKDEKIYFLIPGTGVSGGIAVVFQHANRLLSRGYAIEIFSQSNFIDDSWFPHQKVKIVSYKNCYKKLKNDPLAILIATSWSTAYPVAMSQARRKMYFVQSDESRFFEHDEKLSQLIRSTYELPFEFITEAHWIQCWLQEKFGQSAQYVPNGLDEKLFYPVQSSNLKGDKPRILLEGSIDVPFKGMEDAYAAVKDLDCEIWIVSVQGEPKRGWRYEKFFSFVPFDKMKNLYSSCDVFLKMSRVEGFFGPPMEAMACGCSVVVSKVTGYDEYILDEYNALVVEQGDREGARIAVQRLIQDEVLRNRLIENGYKTVAEWNWEKSVDSMEKVIIN